MSKLDCEVIKDLLPLYVEDLASPSTRKLVEEHLATCKECQKEEASLGTKMLMPQNTDIKAIQKIRAKLLRKKVSTICISVLAMMLIFVLIAINVNAPIMLPYEKVEETVSVNRNEAGELVLSIHNSTLEADIEYMQGEDGVYSAEVSCYTTKWKQLFEKTVDANQVIPLVGEQAIQRISYYPTVSGENVFIYEDTEALGNHSGGYVTLPRLVLRTYMLFAIILSMVGVVVCVCLLKKKNAFYTALKVTLVPVAYFISSVIILNGKGDVYNAAYYFSGILLSTFLMSVIGWWALSLVRYHKMKNNVKRSETKGLQ